MKKTAHGFFRKAINTNGSPEKVVIDKSGANALALHNMNVSFWLSVVFMLSLIEVIDVKYLNNIVEQSHRPIGSGVRLEVCGWSDSQHIGTGSLDSNQTGASW